MRKKKSIQFPISIRQAQKLTSRGGYWLEPLAELLGLAWDWNRQDIQAALARLAAKKGPDYLLGEQQVGEYRPKGTDEVRPQGDDPSADSPFHGGDGNSGEVDHPAATVSPEARLAAADGEQGSPGSGSPTALNDLRPETGVSTSGVDPRGGSSQSPVRGPAQPPSTALGGDGVPADSTAYQGLNPPRDADEAGIQAPPVDGEGVGAGSPEPNNLDGDRPAHRKKWGKSFRAGRQPTNQFGGIHADLGQIGVDPVLLRLARQRLAALVGDAAHDQGPRYDYQEFCMRLLTHRQPNRARKEELGRPIIWILADVSGSCSSFAWPSLQVAKACGKLGVPGADVVAIAHSNGYPANWECNGRPISAQLPEVAREQDILPWFRSLARRYPPQVVVALGDWDAAQVYRDLALLPGVERLLWLDNYGCSRGPRDQTRWALQKLGDPRLRGKVKYIDGCRGAVEFIDQIR